VNDADVQIHQPCMLATFVLTSIGFILVFVAVKRYSKVRFVVFPNASLIVTGINPLIATLKPHSIGPSYSDTVHWPLMGGLLHLIQRPV